MTTTPHYLLPLVDSFEKNANPEIAVQMKQYMRNQFDFFGIKSPERKEIYMEFKKDHGLIPVDHKMEIVQWCWEAPQREYQMFAMSFLGKSVTRESIEILSLYEYMIVTKSWWDTVDYIASNLVGAYFAKFPNKIEQTTKKWMESDNIWLQRTCLLFQLKYRSNLNTNLLHAFIVQLNGSKEFFIQKAIGWILREYSKTNPEFVVNYVAKNELAPLSKREALLWMNKKGIIDL